MRKQCEEEAATLHTRELQLQRKEMERLSRQSELEAQVRQSNVSLARSQEEW